MWTRRKFIKASCSGVAVASNGTLLAASRETFPSAIVQTTYSVGALSPADAAVSSARGVLDRTIGRRLDEFDLSWIPEEDGHPVYEVSATRGRVSIKGSSGVALSRGAYVYLRRACHSMVTWSGRRLDLPSRMPDLPEERRVCPYIFTQYFNPCTFGYTIAFWDWDRWEREFDWMALHGINMPLAMEGQEAIWQKIWLEMGVSQEELDHFSTGPAQLPWHRMGNINNFDGPLPQGWIEGKRQLQIKILRRARELGMTPIAPGFSGFVPQGFKRIHSKILTSTLLWLPQYFSTIPRQTKTFILHPGQEALYKEIGGKFIRAYKAEYGEVKYYLADSFNELTPPVSSDRRYEDLEQFGRTVYEGILAGDTDGTWVMQGWLFAFDPKFWDNDSVKALLAGVPNDRMLIVDYTNDMVPTPGDEVMSEQWKIHRAFFGKRWINGMAHTFGGNNNVKGNLPLVASQPAEVLQSREKGNLVGWGICAEGIENNEVVYELMTDMGWSPDKIGLNDWLSNYGLARYGSYPDAMRQSWALLVRSAYGSNAWKTRQGWQCEPSLEPAAVSVDSGPDFQRAVKLFLSCAPELSSGELYRNDLIELVVQATGGAVDAQLVLAGKSHKEMHPDAMREKAQAAIEMLGRMDSLMNLRVDRRLENWTNSARRWATTPSEAAYYDENARLLITYWGWPELSDYASRVWSGLIRDYYAERWAAYYTALQRGDLISVDIWEQTWLSIPYQPSNVMPIKNLNDEAAAMLETCAGWV